MPSHALHRLLDRYFRHRILYTLPLVAFAVLGGVYAANMDTEYQSDAVLLIQDQSFLSTLTEVGGATLPQVTSGATGWQTPAGYTANQLNSLLQTDAFVVAIVTEAGLTDPAALTEGDYAEVRASVRGEEAGERLLRVSAVHEEAEVAHRLAEATVDSLIQWRIDTQVAQIVAAEEFISPLVDEALAELAAARSALEDYLVATPVPEGSDRPPAQQVIVDQLTGEMADATSRYNQAAAREETVQVAAAQAESDVRAQLQLIDAPKLPTEPEGKTRAAAMAMALFLTIGALFSLAAVVIGAVTDQTLRSSLDVERQLGIDVIAVLPEASAGTLTFSQSSS